MRGHRGWGFTEVSTRFRENLPWLLGGHRVYGDGKVSISPCLDRRIVRLAGGCEGPRGWGFTEDSTRFRENLTWLFGGQVLGKYMIRQKTSEVARGYDGPEGMWLEYIYTKDSERFGKVHRW